MTDAPGELAPADDGMLVIDLDALRAARAEARGGKRPAIRLGGAVYPLPEELPLEVLADFGALVAGDLTVARRACEAILGPNAVGLVSVLTIDDLLAIIDSAGEHYGLTSGNS